MANRVGTSGNDSLVGTSGDDTLEGLAGNDTLIGLAGNDRLVGGSGSDSMNGGSGNDFYVVGSGDVLSDSGGIETVETSVSWILGAGFEHLFSTGSANISLRGNNLDNTISGNSGANWMRGAEGNDWLAGGEGNDTFNMSNGSSGNYGNDTIDGGAGIDTLDYGAAALTAVRVDFSIGWAQGGAAGGGGTVTVWDVENANGSAFDDVLFGSAVGNFFFGYNGNDQLDGREGNDRLEGGAGSDDYRFTVAPGAANADTIVGFVSGSDDIVLHGSVHVNLGPNGDFVAGDTRFVSGAGLTAARDESDRVIYNTTTGQLFYDLDGSRTGASPQLIATLQGAPTLLATDIVAEGSSTGTVRNGTAGDDTIVGTPGDDTINGLGGNDRLQGDDGQFGSEGHDRLDGGTGNDFLIGMEGGDSLIGGEGHDTLDGGTGYDVGVAEATRLADTLDGGAGNDVYLIGSNAADVIRDSGGIDEVRTDTDYTLGSGLENLSFTTFQFNDLEGLRLRFTGNNLDNVITVFELWHSSESFLTGGEGDDTLDGGGEAFYLFSGNYGNDVVVGGSWSDTLDFSQASSAVTIDLPGGTASGGGTNGSGSVTFENVGQAIGGAFNDHIVASPNGSTPFDYPYIRGGGGSDTLMGAASGTRYYLYGDDGNDTLVVRTGSDLLTGGAGADSLVFAGAPGGDSWLFDFASGTDTIVLDATFMTELGASGDFTEGDARFYSAADATGGHDADDRVIYNTSTGELFYDSDGDALTAAPELITRLIDPTTQTVVASDIAVVNGTEPPPPGGETINGTEGNDSLVGTEGDDTINGLGGNDTIEGFAGSDSLNGGDGNDSIFGGISNSEDPEAGDIFVGGSGDDTLDSLASGFAQNDDDIDTLDGGLGNDVFMIDNPGDVLTDAGGVDSVRAVNMDWTLGPGFENLRLNNDEEESLNIGIGNELDNFMEGGWIVRLEGLGGNDTIVGSPQRDQLFGGDGNDSIFGGGLPDSLDGGAGDDTLAGGGGMDAAAPDTMTGGAGADRFDVANLHSLITDFASTVDVIVLDGDFFENVGASGDFAPDDERFYAAPGATAPQDDTDRFIYDMTTGDFRYDEDGDGAAGTFYVGTLQGAPSLVASDITVVNGTSTPPPPSGQTINGTTGNDTLVGGAGNDTINGNTGADVLQGMGGNDSLLGSPGHDTLQGGDGDDTLVGGWWSDTLTGGAGSDSFVYAEIGTNHVDRVTDFTSGTDELVFDNSSGSLTALAEGSWSADDGRFYSADGATSGHDADDRIIYNTSSGSLYYDSDGSGATSSAIVATFQGTPTITASDITVI